jgi:excisionase family DNA binding protein
MLTTATGSGGLHSRAEAAKYLSMSMRRLDDLIKSGALCAVRDGRSVKVSRVELERYITDLPAYEPAGATA